jgi:hypothetical protein
MYQYPARLKYHATTADLNRSPNVIFTFTSNVNSFKRKKLLNKWLAGQTEFAMTEAKLFNIEELLTNFPLQWTGFEPARVAQQIVFILQT